MTYYIGIVHKDPDSSYGISFPDLPGCFSAGADLDELERNAIEAIDLFLDDQDVADFPARDLAVIGEAMAGDDMPGTLIAVPYIRSGGRTVRVNFTIDSGTLSAIDAAAKRGKMTRSAFLANAARQAITA